MRKHTPPQSLFFLVGEEITHCPPTVSSGDTLCVTAGDARRENPWRSGEREKRETSQPASTVPSGDTPCVTAGDARRENPWRSGEGEKRETSQPAPTVPGGDTPCLTAGDARRANPWRELHSSLRHQRCRTTSTFTHTSLYSLNAFSATPLASESSLCTPPTGSPSPQLGHHPRLSMVRLRRRRKLRCEDATEIVKGQCAKLR